jgi:hypothetical protein
LIARRHVFNIFQRNTGHGKRKSRQHVWVTVVGLCS